MIAKSADGRGRTLWDILTKKNQADTRPLELQYYNPLACRVGSTISFDHEPVINEINFVVEKISVYETKIGSKIFYHSDYHIRGISLEQDAPLKFRLRLTPDQDALNGSKYRIQLLHLSQEMPYDHQFVKTKLQNPNGELEIDSDIPKKYWRVEDVFDPYNAKVTILKDSDGNGTIEDSELAYENITYYDYSRLTEDANGAEVIEFLTVELDKDTGYLTFLVGNEILPSQITVY